MMDWSYFVSDAFLTRLDLSMWFIQLAGLAAFYYVAKKQQIVNSSLVSIFVVLAISAIMFGYEAFLNANINPDQYNPLITFSWYVGFAALDVMCILMLVGIHRLLNLDIGTVGRFMGLGHFILGLLQLVRYSEIWLTGGDKILKEFYPAGVVAVNLLTTSGALVLGLMTVLVVYRRKDATIGGLKWIV